MSPESLRGFGLAGIISILVIVLSGNLLGAALVVVWAQLSGTRWSDLGFVRLPHGAIDLVIAFIAGVLFELLMKAVVMPLVGFGSINSAYHYLVANPAALPGMFFLVIVGAGFGEELIWRGFLFNRLGALIGPRRYATLVIVIFTSMLFGLAHYHDQGVPGAVQATITGLVFGVTYARIRTIWPVMVAHAAFDVTAVLIIYWNLEEQIGRSLVPHLR